MSKYTTSVRFICENACGLRESKGEKSVEEIISLSLDKVFDFNFPIFDESYRNVLETKILKHFYTREIGEETVGLWKLRLNTRLNEIMPYYNKLYNSELLAFNPLYTENVTRERKTKLDSNRKTNNNGNVDSTSNVTNIASSISTDSDLYSDTPQGSLNGIDATTYLTSARKVTNNSSNDITSTSKEGVTSVENGSDAFNSTEDYLESVAGFSGISGSDLLLKYRETFLNIDVMIINDLEDLFFQLW